MRGQFQGGEKNTGFRVETVYLTLVLPFADRATLDK